MYREWLKKMLEGAERGTKTRLAERMNFAGDVVSKMLSGVRDITADELPQIAEFFNVMPPGFEKVAGDTTHAIRDEAEIHAILSRIEGLGERGVELAMMTIQTVRNASREKTPTPTDAGGQSELATPRREAQPSRQR